MIKNIPATYQYNTETDTFDLVLSAPLSVCWQVTRECNLNCKFCLSDSGACKPTGLSKKDALRLIDQLGKLGICRLDFTGGEPLKRKDLNLLIERAKSYGINVIVTTNTTLLNDENLEALKAADLVQVSIDGNEQTHNWQRGADVYKTTIRNIERMKAAGIKIRLNSFIFNSNKDQVDELMSLSKDMDLFSHLFIIFTPQGRGKDNPQEIIPDNEVEAIKEKILARKERENRNIRLYDYKEYMHSCVLLSPEGEVISQGFYEDDSIGVGNMLETPLNVLFSDPIFDHATHASHYLQRRPK